MTLDDIVNFTYERNDFWRACMTKEDLKWFFDLYKNTTIVVRENGILIGVGIYYKVRTNEITFISLTTNEEIRATRYILKALRHIILKEKIEYVSFIYRDNKRRRWRINHGSSSSPCSSHSSKGSDSSC